MPVELTEDLLNILGSRFQAAAHGYRGRVEIDYLPAASPGSASIVQAKTGPDQSTTTVTLDNPVTPGDLLVAVVQRSNQLAVAMADAGWTEIETTHALDCCGNGAAHARYAVLWRVATGSQQTWSRESTSAKYRWRLYELADADPDDIVVLSADRQDVGGRSASFDLGTFTGATGVVVAVMGETRGSNQATHVGSGVWTAGMTEQYDAMENEGGWVSFADATPAGDDVPVEVTFTESGDPAQTIGEWAGIAVLFGGTTPVLETLQLQPRRISRDFSRRMAAAEAVVEIPNEDGALDLSPTGPIKSHHPIRIFQWFGDQANEVRTFTGFVDAVRESRDPRTVTLTCRDVMKRLIVQTFSATAPQGAGEDGAVRTAANGVYLEMEADAIVTDILDRAGWPAADRDIAPTGYALDEYVLADGVSWAEAIIGENALTGLTGYDAWADTSGIFHFRPPFASAAPDSDTAPTPDYSYIVSADAVEV